MIPTFNGCSRSNFTVSPNNWRTKKASITKPWRIFYRFYDPAFKDKYPGGKDIPIRDMNKYKTLEDRQEATRELLRLEEEVIDRDGYNPITEEYMSVAEMERDITKRTPLAEALHKTLPLLQLEGHTVEDMKSVLKYFCKSAEQLDLHRKAIGSVSRGEIIKILDNCKNLTVVLANKKRRKKIWTSNQFNHYRKYLSMLYTKIELDEVLEYNPIEKIPLAEEEAGSEKAPLPQLTSEEARKIDIVMKAKFPRFHRLIHIFFHGGARRTEIMRIQGKHVDLANQRYRVLVKKRKKRNRVWVWKTIKDIALPYWKDAMEGCGPEDYLFSVGLKPGPRAIRPEQVSRRWKRHVKSLGILANFYFLKKKNTTETVNAIMEFMKLKEQAQKHAAEHNSHTSNAMVVAIYDTEEQTRIHEQMKKVGNALGA